MIQQHSGDVENPLSGVLISPAYSPAPEQPSHVSNTLPPLSFAGLHKPAARVDLKASEIPVLTFRDLPFQWIKWRGWQAYIADLMAAGWQIKIQHNPRSDVEYRIQFRTFADHLIGTARVNQAAWNKAAATISTVAETTLEIKELYIENNKKLKTRIPRYINDEQMAELKEIQQKAAFPPAPTEPAYTVDDVPKLLSIVETLLKPSRSARLRQEPLPQGTIIAGHKFRKSSR